MQKKEIWKEYPLDFDFEGSYRIEVSDKGNIKTYNTLNPGGKIIKGSLQGGFPIIRIKLFRKRSETDQNKLNEVQEQIDVLNSKIKSWVLEKKTLKKSRNCVKSATALFRKEKSTTSESIKKDASTSLFLNTRPLRNSSFPNLKMKTKNSLFTKILTRKTTVLTIWNGQARKN